jgi:hypothetical protein
MAANWITIEKLAPVFGDLNPVEKWQSARGPFAGPGGGSTWILVGLVVLGILGAAALTLVVYAHLQQRSQHREFRAHAEKVGLSGEETRLLRSLAKTSGVKRPAAVFTMADAFERGASTMLDSDRLAAMPDQRRQEVGALLGRMREKLGFQDIPGRDGGTSISFGKIPEGTTVAVLRKHLQQYFDATVVASTPTGTGLEITPQEPVRCEPGETWEIRYDDGGLLWESNAAVVKQVEDRVALKPIGTARSISRRRFPRTSTTKSASVALFPFLDDTADAEPPVFTPATLVEIAGPGLRLEAPVSVEAGDRILVRVKSTTDRILQGLAVVRRVTTGADGVTNLAAEMIGLTTSEVAQLVRETNLSSTAGRTEEAPVSAEEG